MIVYRIDKDMALTIEQRLWTHLDGWKQVQGTLATKANIVFVFGGREEVIQEEHVAYIQNIYPETPIVFCSTAGEILDTKVYDNSLCVTAVAFESTKIVCTETTIAHVDEIKFGCFFGSRAPS